MILILLLIFAFLVLAIVRLNEERLELPAVPPAACPECGCRIELDWLICPHCKELLQRPCPDCRASMPVVHRFCTDCGVRQRPIGPEMSQCA